MATALGVSSFGDHTLACTPTTPTYQLGTDSHFASHQKADEAESQLSGDATPAIPPNDGRHALNASRLPF
jgi:hypothetical protein